jgi:tyrosine-protein kinase Etk/Wzc
MQARVRENMVEDGEVDLQRFLGMLIGSRWIILGATFACFLLSLAYVVVAKPVYQADAVVQVEPKSSDLSSTLTSLTTMLDASSALAVTEIDIIKSQRVVGVAVDEMNLATDISPKGGFMPRIFSGYKPGDVVVDSIQMSPSVAASLDGEGGPIAWLNGDIPTLRLEMVAGKNGEYSLYRDSVLIGNGKVGTELQADHGNIAVMISRLNARPDQHFRIVVNPRLYAINDLLDDLDVQENGKDSGVIQISLRGYSSTQTQDALESLVKAYVKQNIIFRAEEAQRGVDFLHDQLPKVKKDLYKSEADLNSFRMQHGALDVDLETKAILDRSALLDAQLSDIALKEAEIGHEYAPGHPVYKALMQQRDAIRKEQEELKSRMSVMPESQQALLRLTRDVQVNEQLYMQMFNQMQALDVQRAGTVGNVRIVDDATAELVPVRPRKPVVLGIGLLIGLTIGLAIAFVRARLNAGIESVEELEDIGISVVAVVPLSDIQTKAERAYIRGARRGQDKKFKLLSVEQADDVAVEALRSLRTSLHFMLQAAKNNIVMISGPAPGVGKTFASGNLGVVLSQGGQRVLIIDGDLRRGTLHELFAISHRQGLAELLSGHIDRTQAIQNSGVSGLDILPRGTAPGNPAELLMRPEFNALMEWASANYDVVIVDTPPVLAVTDAAIIGRFAATVMLVVRHRKSSTREVDLAFRRLEQNGISVNGCVLNGLQRGGGDSYGYAYYTYDYKSVSEK